jgi:hypothetical protein
MATSKKVNGNLDQRTAIKISKTVEIALNDLKLRNLS